MSVMHFANALVWEIIGPAMAGPTGPCATPMGIWSLSGDKQPSYNHFPAVGAFSHKFLTLRKVINKLHYHKRIVDFHSRRRRFWHATLKIA